MFTVNPTRSKQNSANNFPPTSDTEVEKKTSCWADTTKQGSKPVSSKMENIKAKTVVTISARTLGVAFLIAGCFAIPEARKFNTVNEYIRDGTTLYIPLEVCEPASLEIDGQTISYEADEVGNCHDLRYLVNACIAGIIFAMSAMVLFFVFDILERYKKGKVKRSSVLGMSLFMFFILIQAGACLLALYSESIFWTGYFERIYDKLPEYGIEDVRTHGKTVPLLMALVFALASACALLLDSIWSFCSEEPNASKTSKTSSGPITSSAYPEETSTSPSTELVAVEPGANADSDVNKSWVDKSVL